MSETAKKVSVILPVYNAEKYLRDTILSVLEQTYQNFELIIVDDCSKDNSLRIIYECAAKDSRIKVLRNETNQGAAACRNRCIQEATGSYIAFLDSDDLWTSQKLESQIELLTRTEAQFTYAAYDFMDENGNPILKPHFISDSLDFEMILRENSVLCSTVCADASLLKAHPFRCEYYHEDYVLWLELFRLPIDIKGSPEVLTHYRISKKSRSYNKLRAAKERWKIYRQFLEMNVLKSAFYFAQYAVNGLKKYCA